MLHSPVRFRAQSNRVATCGSRSESYTAEFRLRGRRQAFAPPLIDPGAPENIVAVRIRLKRIGRRHKPVYRVTAVDGRRARDSKVIEELGSYDPTNRDESRQVSLKRERIDYWISVGAKPSDTVQRLMRQQAALADTQ